jgi:diguanylate cyclase (GGDEF)-like protein/PAS domain S-box-containing protein
MRALVCVNALLLAQTAVWLAFNARAPAGPAILGWLACTPAAAATALALALVAQRPSLPAPVRRFWARLSLSAAILALAFAVNAYVSLGRARPSAAIPLPALALQLVAMLLVLWALLRLPVGRRTRAEWLRLGLDGATIMLAATLFVWYFVVSPRLLQDDSAGSVWVSLAVASVCFGIVSAITKVVLAGAGGVDRGSLHVVGLALALGGASAALEPLVGSEPQLSVAQITVPGLMLLGTIAGARQWRVAAGARRPAAAAPRTRPYSVLPYVAVAAAAGLLLAVAAAGLDARGIVVAIGAVSIAGVVVVRQIAAFNDNARLLGELGRQELRFRSLVQHTSEIITITSADGTTAYVSPAIEAVLGFSPERWVGGVPLDSVHPEDLPAIRKVLAGLVATPGASAEYRGRMRHANGSWRWLEFTSTNLLDDPSVEGVVSNARDVTETVRHQARLGHQASHDDLTGLANRVLFVERVEAALAARGSTEGLAVLLIDLDDFKTVNDTLGHAAGDALLTAVGLRLRRCVRPRDTVARLGGDEFAVLLADVDPEGSELGIVAERILDSLRSPVVAGGHSLLVRASIGVSTGASLHDPDAFLRDADIAMYAAKESGTAGYLRYHPDMGGQMLEHARTGEQLREALERDEFHLVYQPIVGLTDGRAVGVEALLRWQHPERGPVAPLDFLSTAERTGLIVPLGAWVLRRACEQAAAWHREALTEQPLAIAVNVAARQLREPGFAATVAAVLEEVGLAPEHLMIEVTETSLLQGGQILQALRDVRGAGVRVALDDFGTGQSSLSLLQTCPADILKLHKSFVDGIGGLDQQAAVASALLEIARALGLEAVAEGIESQEQADRLAELGYRFGQGYHFARPLVADAVRDVLASGRQLAA